MDCSCRTFLREHPARPWCFPSGALMWVPETPPEHLPLECDTWAGFSLVDGPPDSFRRGDCKESLPGWSEHSPLRRCYLPSHLSVALIQGR